MRTSAAFAPFDPAYLRERLRYDPATGKLFWRHHSDMPNNWLARYPGTEAFTTPDKDGYLQGSLGGYKLKAHRVIWAMVNDEWIEEVDHEDHDRANNRIGNLREASRLVNCRNASRSRKNTSGTTGVSWRTRVSRWHAYITVKRRSVHLGMFDSFEDAVAARKAAEIEYGFHPNHGRAAA